MRNESNYLALHGALTYARVSSDEQAKGYSLQTQEEGCRRYCAQREHDVLAGFSDAHTGTELDRPGFNALVEATRTLRPEVIVIYDVDRLGRETYVQAVAERELERYGARIEYVLGGGNGDPSSELTKNVKQAIAVYENRQRAERSKRGKTGTVRDGVPLVFARPPYGYRVVYREVRGKDRSFLALDPDEAPVMRQIFDWCANEGVSMCEIARRLHAQGIPTRADSSPVVVKKNGFAAWSPVTITRMLKNATYKGEWFYNKTKLVAHLTEDGRATRRQVARPREEWLCVPVEPLIDDVTWERAQRQLAQNKVNARRNAKREYLLRGRARCACGRVLRAYYTTYFDRAYYRCPLTAASAWCSSCSARFGLEQTKFEGAVLGAVKAFLLDPAVRHEALDAERERAAAERERITADLATIDAKVAQIDRQLGRLLDQTLADAFPAAQLAERSRTLMADRATELARRERRLTELAAPDSADVEAVIEALAPTVEAAFAGLRLDEIRRIFDLLRLEVHVIDREHVRLTGILESIVTLSSRQKRHNCAMLPFSFTVDLLPRLATSAAD